MNFPRFSEHTHTHTIPVENALSFCVICNDCDGGFFLSAFCSYSVVSLLLFFRIVCRLHPAIAIPSEYCYMNTNNMRMKFAIKMFAGLRLPLCSVLRYRIIYLFHPMTDAWKMWAHWSCMHESDSAYWNRLDLNETDISKSASRKLRTSRIDATKNEFILLYLVFTSKWMFEMQNFIEHTRKWWWRRIKRRRPMKKR